MKISKKLYISFGLLIAILVTMSANALLMTTTIQGNLDNVTHNILEGSQEIAALQAGAVDLVIITNEYLDGEGVTDGSSREWFNYTKGEITNAYNTLKTLHLPSVQTHIEDIYDAAQAMVVLIDSPATGIFDHQDDVVSNLALAEATFENLHDNMSLFEENEDQASIAMEAADEALGSIEGMMHYIHHYYENTITGTRTAFANEVTDFQTRFSIMQLNTSQSGVDTLLSTINSDFNALNNLAISPTSGMFATLDEIRADHTNIDIHHETIISEVTEINEFFVALAEQAEIEADNAVNVSLVLIFSFLAVGVGMSVFIAYSVSKSINTSINQITEKISSTVKSKDLTTRVEKLSDDEIGIASKYLNDLLNFAEEIVSRTQDAASSVTAASEELASSTEELNATSEEISSISQQISKGSISQSEQIVLAAKMTSTLKEEYQEKIKGVNNAAALIENITGQVNMLALNASIEAARAGEYGRGFAVVAENIRQLAEEAKSSLGEVTSIIADLQNTLERNIESVNSSIQSVASIAEETAAGAEEASSATEEQAATSQEMSASAQELADLATSLSTFVSVYKANPMKGK